MDGDSTVRGSSFVQKRLPVRFYRSLINIPRADAVHGVRRSEPFFCYHGVQSNCTVICDVEIRQQA